jgi:hypothetical protein
MPAVDPALQWLARIALAFVLLRAAWHKTRDLGAFRSALTDYDLLPRAAVPAVASTLALLEGWAAVALWVPATAAFGAALAGGLLALYSGAIATNLLRGRSAIDCGCAGPAGGRPLGAGLLLRNAALIVVALAGAAPASARALEGVDVLTVALGAAGASLLYVASDLALGQAPRLRALAGRA